ncbi:MAG: NUDIX hydrolase [Myxococcota bacterium]
MRALQLPPSYPEPEGVEKRAAVAIVAGPDEHLLFIRRADREGDPWSGHMAFPGGRVDPADASVRAAAERETMEEVGLDLRDAAFVGALTPLRSPLRTPTVDFAVFPFVWRVAAWPAFAPSDEVAAIHTFALARIRAGEGRGTFRYRGYGFDTDLPCLDLDGQRIWGMTLRMLDDLLGRLG